MIVVLKRAGWHSRLIDFWTWICVQVWETLHRRSCPVLVVSGVWRRLLVAVTLRRSARPIGRGGRVCVQISLTLRRPSHLDMGIGGFQSAKTQAQQIDDERFNRL